MLWHSNQDQHSSSTTNSEGQPVVSFRTDLDLPAWEYPTNRAIQQKQGLLGI